MYDELRKQFMKLNMNHPLNANEWIHATQAFYDKLYQHDITRIATNHVPDLDVVSFLQQRPNPYKGNTHLIHDLIDVATDEDFNEWYLRPANRLTEREIKTLTHNFEDVTQKVAIGTIMLEPTSIPTKPMLTSRFLTFASDEAFGEYLRDCLNFAYLHEAVLYATETEHAPVTLNTWGTFYISQRLKLEVEPFDTVIDDRSFHKLYNA